MARFSLRLLAPLPASRRPPGLSRSGRPGRPGHPSPRPGPEAVGSPAEARRPPRRGLAARGQDHGRRRHRLPAADRRLGREPGGPVRGRLPEGEGGRGPPLRGGLGGRQHGGGQGGAARDHDEPRVQEGGLPVPSREERPAPRGRAQGGRAGHPNPRPRPLRGPAGGGGCRQGGPGAPARPHPAANRLLHDPGHPRLRGRRARLAPGEGHEARARHQHPRPAGAPGGRPVLPARLRRLDDGEGPGRHLGAGEEASRRT